MKWCLIATLAFLSSGTRANWCVGWTNNAIWPNYRMAMDLCTAGYEKCVALKQPCPFAAKFPTNSIWPSRVWLPLLDQWIQSEYTNFVNVCAIKPNDPHGVTLDSVNEWLLAEQEADSSWEFPTDNRLPYWNWTNLLDKAIGKTNMSPWTIWRSLPAMQERRKVLNLLYVVQTANDNQPVIFSPKHIHTPQYTNSRTRVWSQYNTRAPYLPDAIGNWLGEGGSGAYYTDGNFTNDPLNVNYWSEPPDNNAREALPLVSTTFTTNYPLIHVWEWDHAPYVQAGTLEYRYLVRDGYGQDLWGCDTNTTWRNIELNLKMDDFDGEIWEVRPNMRFDYTGTYWVARQDIGTYHQWWPSEGQATGSVQITGLNGSFYTNCGIQVGAQGLGFERGDLVPQVLHTNTYALPDNLAFTRVVEFGRASTSNGTFAITNAIASPSLATNLLLLGTVTLQTFGTTGFATSNACHDVTIGEGELAQLQSRCLPGDDTGDFKAKIWKLPGQMWETTGYALQVGVLRFEYNGD